MEILPEAAPSPSRPEDLIETRQLYEPDSEVLVTEMRSRSGIVRVIIALTLRSGANLAEDAPAELGALNQGAQGAGMSAADSDRASGRRVHREGGGGMRLHCVSRPDLDLRLWSTIPLEGLRTILDLRTGECSDAGAALFRSRPRALG